MEGKVVTEVGSWDEFMMAPGSKEGDWVTYYGGYLDGRYTTDRRLVALFGRHNDETYRRLLGERFAVSATRLAPLLVFHGRLG